MDDDEINVAAATQAAMNAAEELLDAMDDAFAEFDDEDFDLDFTEDEEGGDVERKLEAESENDEQNDFLSGEEDAENNHNHPSASSHSPPSAGVINIQMEKSLQSMSPAQVPKNINANAMDVLVSPLQMPRSLSDNSDFGRGNEHSMERSQAEQHQLQQLQTQTQTLASSRETAGFSSNYVSEDMGMEDSDHSLELDDLEGDDDVDDSLELEELEDGIENEYDYDIQHQQQQQQQPDTNLDIFHNVNDDHADEEEEEEYYNSLDIEIDDFGEMSETLSIMDMSKPLEPINEEDGDGIEEEVEVEVGGENDNDVCYKSKSLPPSPSLIQDSEDNNIQDLENEHVIIENDADESLDADINAGANGNREAMTVTMTQKSRQVTAPLHDQEEKKCESSDEPSDEIGIEIENDTDDPLDRNPTSPVSISTAGSVSPSASGSESDLDLSHEYFKIQKVRSDELAKSNAEDVVNLSLEVQKLKDELEKSTKKNSEINAELEAERARMEELKMELQQQRKEFLDAKEKYCVDVQELMVECQQSKIRIQAAEEDAEQALELAKASDASRAEMEEYLQRSLDEIEQLRTTHAQQQTQTLPRISEDPSTPDETDGGDSNNYGVAREGGDLVPYNRNSSASPRRRINRHKAVVSMGRNLLRQVMESDDGSASSTPDGSSLGGSTTGSVYTSNSYYSTSSRKSVHNRHRIIERLNRSNDEFSPLRKDLVVFEADSGGLDLSYTAALSSTMKNVGRVIRQSGKAMKLGGRWFSRRSSRISSSRKNNDAPNQDELDMEAMTKSYCKTVESLVSKQKEEIKELKSFCEYLEEKVTETTT